MPSPGQRDLTADVDFPRVRRICESEGLSVHGPVSQSYFLTRLGARERAQYLSRPTAIALKKSAKPCRNWSRPTEMGERFKAIALTPHGVAAPPGF